MMLHPLTAAVWDLMPTVQQTGRFCIHGMQTQKACFCSMIWQMQEAVITAPGIESFREYVLFIQNGIRLLDADDTLIQTAAADGGEPVDAEDTGEKGYNYRSERFANRLKKDGRVWKVFSSKVHGDPATPIWKAYPGDRVIFRTMMPADKPRNISLAVHGHLWREQPEDALSRVVPLQEDFVS